MVHLWAAAHAWRPDPAYAARARAWGRRLLTSSPSGGADLCCGAAGRSYALLALDALAPTEGWRSAAERAALRAMDVAGPWPNGVLRGFPGLAMLAWDLERRRERGFPLIGSALPNR
jgi:serine/threonine-protein kinase